VEKRAVLWVEHGRPRGLDQAPDAEVVVAIDRAGEVPGAQDWEPDLR
jgi:hypothetical protein